MFSSAVSKEKSFYEIKNPLNNNQYSKSQKSFNLQYQNNNLINHTNINSLNNLQTINSVYNDYNNNIYNQKLYHSITSYKNQKNFNVNYNAIKNRLFLDNNKNQNSNIQTPHYINNFSPKIIVNKSMSAKSLNDKMDYDSFYYNDDKSILKQKILKKINIKHQLKNINKDSYDSFNNISLKTLKNELLRNPLVIKLESGVNINNIYNNSNIYNNNHITNLNTTKNKTIKAYTEKRDKHSNFIDINKKTELFRNFEDLEKKSMEISKRKMKKNYSNKFLFDFKKDNNLIEIKKSLGDIKTKILLKEEKNKINNKPKHSNQNNTINSNQNSIKAMYHISKNNKIRNYKSKYNIKNNTINKMKKLFIQRHNKENNINNSQKILTSPKVNKRYIEDNIPENVLTLSFNNTPTKKILSPTQNKRRKFINNILPSISEEDDKIKLNIINLINVLEKILGNKKIHIVRDSFYKIEEEIKINFNNANITNNKKDKNNSNFKYIKKIIPKNINKNKIIFENNNRKDFYLMSADKGRQKAIGKFRYFGKTKRLIDNLRLKLIEYSLNHKKV